MSIRTRKPDIGSFSGIKDHAVKAALDKIKEVIEANAGLRGDELDSMPTWRALVDSGLVIKGRRGFDASSIIVNPDTGNGPDNPNYDSTIPPAPENFSVNSGYSSITLTWDAPTFESFPNLAYTEVWRSGTDDIGTATKRGVSDGSTPFYVDAVGTGSTLYYYWIRFVSIWDIEGPYNAVEGTSGQSALDPAYVINTISGLIERSDLHANLNSDIGVLENDTGELLSSYVIKLGANGTVAGFGLAQEIIDGNPVSNFIVHADNFAIGSPGQTDAYPFVVGQVNGSPAIGMNAATYILDATITDAKIFDLSADKLTVGITATIAEAIIGDGDITDAMIYNEIKSYNFVAGSSGWRIRKDAFAPPDYQAEFQSIKARGDIEATTLKAQTAMVSTDNVELQAITIPKGSFDSVGISRGMAYDDTWTEIASLNMGNKGSIVLVAYSFVVDVDFYSGPLQVPQGNGDIPIDIDVRIKVNGVAINEFMGCFKMYRRVDVGDPYNSGDDYFISDQETHSFHIQVLVGAATNTYSIETRFRLPSWVSSSPFSQDDVWDFTYRDISLFAMELQR